ncbi:YPR027C-like protein [Saccharomyces kudriavzevii IFO 1802]|uniref:YPR027C-like protein n=2 Tax=Saccharomyces kudriavzevii (strain ATCC MYA-4449 / AS 2.2408 / CBS 8840 / NBRC 1802 / NCYC 2889) TaxID=226230 RepID=J4TVF2_SACK1|nr:YPR027C-like protein [Saccharomyces kudriavzevii IFO 1802]
MIKMMVKNDRKNIKVSKFRFFSNNRRSVSSFIFSDHFHRVSVQSTLKGQKKKEMVDICKAFASFIPLIGLILAFDEDDMIDTVTIIETAYETVTMTSTVPAPAATKSVSEKKLDDTKLTLQVIQTMVSCFSVGENPANMISCGLGVVILMFSLIIELINKLENDGINEPQKLYDLIKPRYIELPSNYVNEKIKSTFEPLDIYLGVNFNTLAEKQNQNCLILKLGEESALPFPGLAQQVCYTKGASKEFTDYSLSNIQNNLKQTRQGITDDILQKLSNIKKVSGNFKSQFYRISETITDENWDGSAIGFTAHGRERNPKKSQISVTFYRDN